MGKTERHQDVPQSFTCPFLEEKLLGEHQDHPPARFMSKPGAFGSDGRVSGLHCKRCLENCAHLRGKSGHECSSSGGEVGRGLGPDTSQPRVTACARLPPFILFGRLSQKLRRSGHRHLQFAISLAYMIGLQLRI